LPELLVFGARAGRAAAEFAVSQKEPNGSLLAQATDELLRLEKQYLFKTGGRERISSLREEMQKTVEAGAGIYRQESSLKQASQKLQELQERFLDVGLDDHGRTFNTELISVLELSAMLDVAETMIQSALNRTESRGAHQRAPA